MRKLQLFHLEEYIFKKVFVDCRLKYSLATSTIFGSLEHLSAYLTTM